MGFTHLDRYADRHSWLTERTTPTQRLWIALAAAFCAGLMAPGAWHALAALAVLVGLGLWAARLPLTALARRIAQALPFFLLPALALPLTVPGSTFFEIGPVTVSEEGSLRALDVILRATLALAALSVVVSVTRAADLLAALDTLPLPRLVKSSLAFGYRYVYVLNDELERMSRALHSRAAAAPRSRLWRARTAALAHLFVRAHARSTRIHAAMLSRGYTDHVPLLRSPASTRPLWTVAILLVLAVIWLVGLIEAGV